MPDQDAAENKALAAANAISEQVGHLYLEAHTEGIRQGLELAALLCQGFTDETERSLEIDSAVRDFLVQASTAIRDHIRLCALQIDDPEVPAMGGDRS